MPMESDRFIPLEADQQDRMHTRQGYGKAKRYDPNRKSISVNETNPQRLQTGGSASLWEAPRYLRPPRVIYGQRVKRNS